MKVSGRFPKPRSFEELLAKAAGFSKAAYYRLLKTALATGYFADGDLITLMTDEERRTLRKKHEALLASSEAYAAAEPLNLQGALPARLGDRIESADYAGEGKEYSLVLLRGNGRERLLEARSFSTLRKRHPTAEWFLAAGPCCEKKPVVLLAPGGLGGERLLGAAAPVLIKSSVESQGGRPREPWRLLSPGLKYTTEV